MGWGRCRTLYQGLDDGYEVLEQSIPRATKHTPDSLAYIQAYTWHVPKTYLPRQEDGLVKRINDVSEIDLSEGTWLILKLITFYIVL